MLFKILLFCCEIELIYSEKESYKHNKHTTKFSPVAVYPNKPVFCCAFVGLLLCYIFY